MSEQVGSEVIAAIERRSLAKHAGIHSIAFMRGSDMTLQVFVFGIGL